MTRTAKAYAKINLGLRVLRKRADGFHDIETIFHRVALYDEVTLSPAEVIEVHSSSPEAPGGPDNICYKAASLVQKETGVSNGVIIRITKNIPVGAGLGGGSSDAAIVLTLLPQLWGVAITTTRLQQLALELGSDVPFFLRPDSAHGTGRGEQLEYFRLEMPYTILLCNPNIHVATGWAYRNVTPDASRSSSLKELILNSIFAGGQLSEALENDFEKSVFAAYPAIQRVKEKMLDYGAVGAAMSGSGSTVFGLFNTEGAAAAAAASFVDMDYKVSITPPHFHPQEG